MGFTFSHSPVLLNDREKEREAQRHIPCGALKLQIALCKNHLALHLCEYDFSLLTTWWGPDASRSFVYGSVTRRIFTTLLSINHLNSSGMRRQATTSYATRQDDLPTTTRRRGVTTPTPPPEPHNLNTMPAAPHMPPTCIPCQ